MKVRWKYKRIISALLATITLISVFSHPIAVAEDETINVTYNVSFPSGNTSWYGNRFPASPTLAGTDSTTLTDTVGTAGTSVRDVSDRMPITTKPTHNAKFKLAVFFTGWRTETGESLEPGSALTWSDLQRYDRNGDGTVRLTAQWSYGTSHTANFCVRYDSKTGQSDTSTSKYTPSIFTTYVNSTNTGLYLDGTNDSDAYGVDKQIRDLYANYGGTTWMPRFPSDAEVFESLKQYATLLSVEGETVNAADLNDTNYAIRWYMIKYDGGDGWHVDGRLVKKKGQIIVNKEFLGDETAIASAKSGFYIVATNGTETNGVFTPYSSSDSRFKQHILVLNNSTAYRLRYQYPNATFQVYDSGDASTHNYKWIVEDVELNEKWQLTEMPVEVDGYSRYSEVSARDTDGNVYALSAYGTSVNVTGKIFALDGDANQGVLVDFRNYYYAENSIFIKKEDGTTGLPLAGATLELWQQNAKGENVQMMFSYDSVTGQYDYDPNGTISQLTLNADNFLIISAAGFSYRYGDITFKEVIAPVGYAAAPNVVVGAQDDVIIMKNVVYPNGTEVEESLWDHAAELEEDGGVLIIKNYASTTSKVTVNKVWSGEAMGESVTIALYANGSLATVLFPTLSSSQVMLSAANNWTYTWNDLPSYANGSPVEWSVKEIRVDSDALLSDGNFANWTVMYSDATKTDKDADGIIDAWSYTITNTVRRTQLIIKKTNLSGTKALQGAVFTLVRVQWRFNRWQTVSGAITYTATSDENGILNFDNLTAGYFYQLTEVQAPEGCAIPQASIVLTLNGAGQVMQVKNGYAEGNTLTSEYHNYIAPYTITVKNILQYSWNITAPETMVFKYEGVTEAIWNPETLQYETSQTGAWNSNAPIIATNLSEADIQLTIYLELTFLEGYEQFDGVTVNIEASNSGFTTTRTDKYIAITGVLSPNETCEFNITLTGVPPAGTTQSPVQIADIAVKITKPSTT